MKLAKLFISINTLIIALLVTLGFISFLILQNQIILGKSQEIRFKSYKIANELKQSSDDLTRFCRNYVSTGDSIWEERYWEVLDIRNGKRPRPDGHTIALQDSMRKLGFTKTEFDKLAEAEKFSNDLVWTEKVAINAMKGLFDDGTGHFIFTGVPDSSIARQIMFDDTYHAAKAKIMTPIGDFFILIDRRTRERVDDLNNRSMTLLYGIITLIILITCIVGYSYFILKKKILDKLEELKLAYNKIEFSEAEIRIQNERLNELNATKDRFISILAHDLKNPLSSMMLLSGLLQQEVKDCNRESVDEYVGLINTTSKNTFKLLEELLEWSRVQQNQTTFNPLNIRLHPIVTDCFLMLSQQASSKDIVMSHQIPDDLYANADADMVKTIFRNLIANAIKFTPRSGMIEIEAYASLTDVEIFVTDNGVGMDEKTRASLFKLGETSSRPGTENERGTGFGLLLCKEFIKKHGGEIAIESEPGKGTKVKFTLPLPVA